VYQSIMIVKAGAVVCCCGTLVPSYMVSYRRLQNEPSLQQNVTVTFLRTTSHVL